MELSELATQQWDFVEKQGWHNKTILEYLALIASEVGEAINECRGEEPSEKLKYELVDIILRTVDLMEELKLDIPQIVKEKMEFNEHRDFSKKVK